MNINDLAIFCVYNEDMNNHFPYRLPSTPRHPKPRALRSGPVIWIVKDGKALELKGE